jgi:multiple sugar transport system permease protein
MTTAVSHVTTASRPAGHHRRPRLAGLAPYAFVAPFVVLFVLFMVIPIALAVWNSFHTVERSGLGFGGGEVKLAGLDNYVGAITSPGFRASIGRVLLFGVVQVPVMLGLALLMALLFDSAVARMKRFFQFAFFVPYAIPTVVAALTWGFLYLPGVSPVVALLRSVNLPHDFLGTDVVLWSIANIGVWQWTGVNMVVIFAALQALPQELYEAARMDGAGEARIARQIKVPLVRPAILLTVVFSIIGTLQLFNEPMVVRGLTPNVTGEYTPNMAVYQTAIAQQDPYLASAMAVVLALLSFGLSAAFLKAMQKRGAR